MDYYHSFRGYLNNLSTRPKAVHLRHGALGSRTRMLDNPFTGREPSAKTSAEGPIALKRHAPRVEVTT